MGRFILILHRIFFIEAGRGKWLLLIQRAALWFSERHLGK